MANVLEYHLALSSKLRIFSHRMEANSLLLLQVKVKLLFLKCLNHSVSSSLLSISSLVLSEHHSTLSMNADKLSVSSSVGHRYSTHFEVQMTDLLEATEPRRSRNDFSRRMRSSTRCGYCATSEQLSSAASSLDLPYAVIFTPPDCGSTPALYNHLVNLPHSLFVCCGTFYRLEQDMQNHINASHLIDQGRRWIV